MEFKRVNQVAHGFFVTEQRETSVVGGRVFLTVAARDVCRVRQGQATGWASRNIKWQRFGTG